MEKLISHSENETKLIGKKFAEKLKKGDVIVLTGELGSGKTKFTEGVLEYFGLENEISSPTFNIVNEYIDDNKINEEKINLACEMMNTYYPGVDGISNIFYAI